MLILTVTEKLYKKASALPDAPGVYIMKDSTEKIIYIGKAKNLKNRVSQYFANRSNHTIKVRRMVDNVNDFDYIIVGSEFEALVLECNLIKQNSPKYNILLKDAKGYSYVKVSGDEWKKLSFTKQKLDDNAKYYGPFTSSDNTSEAVAEALDIFRLPHCAKVFPRDSGRSSRPCLNYYIGKCAGACKGNVTKEENNNAVADAVKFVFGNRADIVKELRNQMEEASENLEFERAAALRDRINAIAKTSQKQHVVSIKYANQDVFGLASADKKSCVNILRFRDGNLVATETFILDRVEEPSVEYGEIITGYYSQKNDLPDRVCINVTLEQQTLIEEYLSSNAGRKVIIYTPLSGEGVTLTGMAERNAREKLTRLVSFDDKKKAALHELQELLGLEKLPSYIESYDISNTAGSENVCGMVVFQDGRPNKRNYKHFRIKSFEGQDDYRSLAEVMERRIGEYELQKDTHCGFGIKPDLILLDGGQGQVNAVAPILAKRGFDVPLFGMVKDGKHRTRAIATNGGEIQINDNRTVFTFLGEIQEEVHRFAIGYHHKLHKKNTLETQLTEIEGIGAKRAKALMLRFGSVASISYADISDLMAVPGMTEPAAAAVYRYYHKSEKE